MVTADTAIVRDNSHRSRPYSVIKREEDRDRTENEAELVDEGGIQKERHCASATAQLREVNSAGFARAD